MTGSHHRPDIQGLRALAVVVVVLFHAGDLLPGGFIGVDSFFVISGFVITGVLRRELAATGRLRLGEFYARRARRLLPSLAVVSVATLVATAIALSPAGSAVQAAGTSMAASLFGANVYLYRFSQPYFSPNAQNLFIHTWSLGVEEQVYLGLPVLLALTWAVGRRLGRERSLLVAVLVVLTVVSCVLGVVVTGAGGSLGIPAPDKFAFYLPVTRLWEFLAGALLVFLPARRDGGSRAAAAVLGFAGLALLLIGCVVFGDASPFPGYRAALPVVATAAMLVGGQTDSVWRRVMSSPPLVWIGDRSYEWYLWHWPAIVVAGLLWPATTWPLVAAGLATLPVAALTKSVVGDRFRFDDRVRGRRALALVSVCTIVPFGTGLVVHEGSTRAWGVESLREYAELGRARSREQTMGCPSLVRTEGCRFGTGDRPLVALVGDSHASAISDMVWDTVESVGADFAVWTRPGCPMLLTSGFRECERWSSSVTGWLRTLQPELVLIHMSGRRDGDGGYRDAASARAFARHLNETVQLFGPSAGTVVVIEDTPAFDEPALVAVSLINRNPKAGVRSLTEVLAEAGLLRDAVAQGLLGPGVEFLPTVERLCAADICSQWSGEWLYRDGHHVTAAGAARLQPLLEERLRAALQR